MKIVRDRFPDATVGLCSIPPRKERSLQQVECNDLSRKINNNLEVIAKLRGDNVIYIDIWSPLMSRDGFAIRRYFSKEHAGLHYNKEGKALVIKTVLQNVGGPRSQKRKQFDDAPSPSTAQCSKEARVSISSSTSGMC